MFYVSFPFYYRIFRRLVWALPALFVLFCLLWLLIQSGALHWFMQKDWQFYPSTILHCKCIIMKIVLISWIPDRTSEGLQGSANCWWCFENLILIEYDLKYSTGEWQGWKILGSVKESLILTWFMSNGMEEYLMENIFGSGCTLQVNNKMKEFNE